MTRLGRVLGKSFWVAVLWLLAAACHEKGEPSAVHVKVGSLVPECADLPEDVSGFGKCLVRLGRKLAPKALVGFSASSFGAETDGK